MQHLNIDKVNKVIISDIDITDLSDGRIEARAIEIFTAEGKFLVTLSGRDLTLFAEGEKKYIKEVKDEEGNTIS